MDALYSEALNLLRAIKEAAFAEEPLLASVEDCDYFRSIYRPSKSELPTQIKIEPPPKPKTASIAEPKKMHSAPLNFVHIEQPPPPPTPSFEVKSHQPERFEDLRKLFAKISPQTRILNEIPKDDLAKQVSERWKTRNQAAPLSLLLHQEPEQHRKLLEHLAQALDVSFGGARPIQCASIENKKQWEAFLSVPELRYVIICDSTLWQLPNLLQFYREIPSHSERFLQNTPLFLLPDLSLYLKDPLLKRSLWKALCQKLE